MDKHRWLADLNRVLMLVCVWSMYVMHLEARRRTIHLTHELHATQAALVQARLKMVEGEASHER